MKINPSITRLRVAFLPQRRPLRWILPGLILLLFLIIQNQLPTWADRAEAWTIDARYTLRGTEPPQSPIIIVALDEDAFQMMGQQLYGENIRFWPRSRWAELIDRLNAGNPQLIGMDIIFDTPSLLPGEDETLQAALARAGNVSLPANLEYRAAGDGTAATLSPPLPSLAQNAAAVGVSTFAFDADGAIRRTTLLYQWGGQTWPAWPLAIATFINGRPLDIDQADLDNHLSLPIHFRGPPQTFPTISAAEVMADSFDAQQLLGAIVLVGFTTQLEQDRHAAPFTGQDGMPGVEIQANAIDTLLAGDWLHRPPDWMPFVLVLLAGLVAIIAPNGRRPVWGAVIFFGSLALYLLIGIVVFITQDLILPLVAPAITAVITSGTAVAERLIFVELEKRVMRQRFAGVMSPERLRAVMDNWDDLTRHDRQPKEAAVLFADIRGFTHATETLMQQGRTTEMVDFLSAYLDIMADAVFAQGGVIYRMLGDGLLILFGLPESLPNYGVSAVKAALGMAEATRSLQAIWPLKDEMPLGMGIGINSGIMLDAIVGGGRRRDYSIIGDSVNAAARIESHCKVAMEIPCPPGSTVPESVTILLGEDLYTQVQDFVIADKSIPPFVAKGKSAPLNVVRLIGMHDQFPRRP